MGVRLSEPHGFEEAAIQALVGGGASGIGFAIAARLAATHDVTIMGRHAETLEPAAKRIGATALVADITDPPPLRPDVLILNAGGPPPGRILDIGDEAWRSGAELLLTGPLRLARGALPAMAERGFGRVVFITSTAVRQPQPDLAVSVVLRAAVTAAAKLLALEYAAQGVTVNCVAPGPTDTARRREILAARAARTGRDIDTLDRLDTGTVPAGRAADPGEIAAAVAFLVSPDASYINGTVLTVDGGRTETI
ncbi:SDR family oxidoreductase [Dactylosporangium sp. NPDC051541]|uniref:SDR family oxidoreductase n=1 Tax=Dactylosporangium sp. NPDC051541 TaxID=3363977 RepID=UPI0037BCBCD9